MGMLRDSENSLRAEVAAISERYALREQDTALKEMWAPFEEATVFHRTQQYQCMAALFRRLGRSSLEKMQILEVGCGSGRLLRACLDLGAAPKDLFGVDLRPDAIAQACELAPHLDFRLGDGINLPFNDNQFDLVMQFVCFSSVFLQPLRERLAGEMLRVLKPGGYVFWWDVATTVNRAAPERLDPRCLFAGLQSREMRVALRPRPSAGLRLPKRIRWLGRVLDVFAMPATHVAALLGPKA
jgi:ubiquinone/menaquinone biosynthesis C-methylase UbiE